MKGIGGSLQVAFVVDSSLSMTTEIEKAKEAIFRFNESPTEKEVGVVLYTDCDRIHNQNKMRIYPETKQLTRNYTEVQ